MSLLHATYLEEPVSTEIHCWGLPELWLVYIQVIPSTVQQAPLQKTFQRERPFAGALPGQPPLEETHRSGV